MKKSLKPNPEKCWPNSVTPTSTKFFERLLLKQITEHLNEKKLLTKIKLVSKNIDLKNGSGDIARSLLARFEVIRNIALQMN